MNKALKKEMLRSVKRTKTRFISIMAIVALGISFFAGINAASPDMKATAKNYYNKNNLMDIWMVSTLGFNEDDVNAVKNLDGVASASGSKFADGTATVDGNTISDIGGAQTICRVFSFDVNDGIGFTNGQGNEDYINRLNLIEGNYPKNRNECLVDAHDISTPKEFVIGSKIKVEGVEENIENKLAVTEFTVVGIIQTPRFVSFERGQTTVGSGALGCFMYVPEDAFSIDYYTELFVTVNDTDKLDPYSSEYENAVKPIIKDIQNISSYQLQGRIAEVKIESEKKLDKARAELSAKEQEAESKLGEAFSELEKYRDIVNNGDEEIAKAEAEFNATLSEKQKELYSGKSEYKAATKEYNQKIREYQKGLEEYNKYKKNSEEAAKQMTDLTQRRDSLDIKIANTQSKIDALMASEGGGNTNAPEPTTGEGETNPPEPTTKSEQLQKLEEELNEYKKQRIACNSAIFVLKASYGNSDTELAKAKAELEDAKRQLDEAKKELESSGIKIDEGEYALSTQQKQIQSQINQKRQELEDAKEKLAGYDEEYSAEKEEAYAKLDEARYDIEEAENQLEEATSGNAKWFVNDRNVLPGYEGYGQTSENMRAFATVFPLFFFIVAALVSLTTMTRMVDEERTQIGTLKAMGYSRQDIIKKYLYYAFYASIIGSVIGLSVGFFIYPKAIFAAYGLMYQFPPLTILFIPKYIVIGTAFAVLSTILPTYFACRKEMKECPSQLMRPKAPKAGKRVFIEKIPFLWKTFSFTSKVTVRNIFRNKKRFLMTLVGIAGCAALLVTGLGLKDSINAIITAQYGSSGISTFDAQIALKNSQPSLSPSPIYKTIIENEKISDALMGHTKTLEGSSEKSETSLDVFMFIPEDNERLSEFVDLKNRKTGEKHTLSDNGVFVTEKFADMMNISVGDKVHLKFSDNLSVNIVVNGIVENYTYHYVYMTRNLYESIFNQPVKYNYVYIKYAPDVIKNNQQAVLAQELMKYNDINAVIDVDTVVESFSTMFDSLNLVVWVFVISAAALAFVVLYNLTNININERVREIASIKVLGFTEREASSYVYRENLVLTVFGAAIGLFGGIYLHKFVVAMAEVNVVMFGRAISPMSFAIAAALTFVFSLIVNFIMYFYVKKIDMVESLKSVE